MCTKAVSANMAQLNQTYERLLNFNIDLIQMEELDDLAMGVVNDLPNKISKYLLTEHDEDVRIHHVRTIREANKLPSRDVVIYDDGRELAIFWHDCCIVLA